MKKELADYLNGETAKLKAEQRRKTGEHLMVPSGGFPRCATCGADEDDVYVGGEKCSYRKGDK